MANKVYKEMTFSIDSATAVITAITCYVNQADIASTLEMLEDSALCDEEQSFLPGIAGASVSLNGFVNSTTDAIFGPLVGNRTSLTKTVDYYNGIKHYTGEVYTENVAFSGSVNSLVTFSATLRFDGAVTQTSVAAS